MIKDKNPVTEKILNLTLEIICLLTGEGYMVVKKPSDHDADSSPCESEGLHQTQSPIMDHSPNLLTHKRKNDKKILQLPKDHPLPNTEVPVRCEDVAVYLSMEEWEYLEEHKEHYKKVMKKNQQPLSLHGGENVRPELITSNDRDPELSITDHPDPREKRIRPDNCAGESSNTNTPERRPISPCSQDCKEEDNGTAQDYQMESGELIFPQQCKEEQMTTDISTGLSSSLEAQHEGHPCPLTVPHCAVNVGSVSPDGQGRDLMRGHSPNKRQRRSTMCLSSSLEAQREAHPSPRTASHCVVNDGSDSHNGQGADRMRGSSTSKRHRRSAMIPDRNTNLQEELNAIVSTSVHTETEYPATRIECNEETSTQLNQVNTSIVKYECTECEIKCNNELDFIEHQRTHRDHNVNVFSAFQPYFTRVHAETEYSSSHVECTDTSKQMNRVNTSVVKYEGETKCNNELDFLAHQTPHSDQNVTNCSEFPSYFGSVNTETMYPSTHGECKGEPSRQVVRSQRIHTGGKLYPCAVCGKYLASRYLLLKHRMFHTGEKPFTCSECGKCFTLRTHLVRHQRIHTGEKQFGCSECGKYFTFKYDLLRHQRIHTGDKPYACFECGKSYISHLELVTHQRIHTGEKPFACSECGKCFTRSSSLIVHQKIHSGSKPYVCSDCGKCFIHKSAHDRHRSSHTQEKPYSCSDCGKCFKQNTYLVKHLRTHRDHRSMSPNTHIVIL